MEKLVKLPQDTDLSAFDCGDDDLNEFLKEDAIHFQEKHIANTFVLMDEGCIVAYFCLLNDKISRVEITNSRWKRIKDSFPDGKQFHSYPSIKIGRLAVDKNFQGKNVGRRLMSIIKSVVNRNSNPSAFRFLTVDAYLSAISYYEKCGFVQLSQKDENVHTRLMYYDMLAV